MNVKQTAEKLKSYGRYGDTELVHMSKGEVNALRGLAQVAGGDLTTNPDTGQPEAFFLAALLPTLVGGVGGAMGLGAMGTAALGAGVGALTNRDNPLMGAISGGMGGFGGGQLAAGLTGLGANAAQQAAQQAAAQQTAATMASGVDPMLANALRPEVLQNATSAASQQFAAQPFYSQLGQGARAVMQPGGLGAFSDAMGGSMKAVQAAGMAAAPLMHMPPRQAGGEEDDGEMAAWGNRRYTYNANPTGARARGSEEVRHFNPTFTRMAEGGLAMAAGGQVPMQSGGFVVPADVTAYAGGGSTEAGQNRLAQKLGASPIRGPGDGLSDDIPASIDGRQPARVADGEMYIDAEQVARVGGGDHKRGVRKLYNMLDNVRKQAVGHTKQAKRPNLDKALR